jgi:hypothetical protein
MTEQRKTTSPPIVANIPAELMEVTQWVVWRFEWRKDKWTKVPFTPHTTSKARSNAASSWRSFKSAYSCYLERPDFFDGIGFMFSKDDPYVGGDRDHSLDLEGIPPTYAEISPSGEGVKFIARATGEYGRKTARGELYSKGRFFTLTGNVIPGHAQITACQAAVEAFHASLGGTEKETREGTAGSGSRAARAASIPDEEWQAGRDQLRSNINSLLARLRASSVSKKVGVETQLHYLLREDYRGFHIRWPGAGLVRGDGSIDESQIRAVFSNSIRMRGFTFPEYVALMSHFFAEEALAKWGTKQAWREEMACLWLRGRTPRQGEAEAPAAPPVARGRAGSHADLLDRAYAVLQSYRAGASAILTIADLAKGLGVHRRTAITAIADLVAKKRITSQKHGQHGGLIIHFSDVIYKTSDVIYSGNKNGHSPDTNNGNGHHTNGTQSAGGKTIDHISDVIYSDNDRGLPSSPGAEETTDAENSQSAEAEETPNTSDVIYSKEDSSKSAIADAESGTPNPLAERENEAPLYIYITSTVYLPGSTITSEKHSLADAVSLAFDELSKSKTNDETGEVKRWPVTAQRVEAEETPNTSDVIYSKEDSSKSAIADAESGTPNPLAERENEAPLYIYITSTVYLPGSTITSEKHSLADAVSLAFDELSKSKTNDETGEVKRWPVTAQRVEGFIQEEYPGKWPPAAIRYWVGKIRKRRKSQPFDELRAMKRDAIEKKAAALRKRIAKAEEKAITAEMPELREWYAKEAKRLVGQQSLLAWELGKRDQVDEARIEKDGYSQGEQAEMLELVERAIEQKPLARKALKEETRAILSSPVPGLIERLKARQ